MPEPAAKLISHHPSKINWKISFEIISESRWYERGKKGGKRDHTESSSSESQLSLIFPYI